MVSDRARLRNVQALRAVAAVAVVLAHLGGTTGIEDTWLAGDYGWLRPLHFPGNAGVDLFFVISGLIMVVTASRMTAGTASAGTFLYRRATRIYPVYWVATLPVLALFLLAPQMVNSSASAPPRILESLLLLPQPGAPLLLVGWTLTFELYFYLVFALALLLPPRRRPFVLGAWGAVIVALAFAFPTTTQPWLALVSSPLSLEFLFGAVVGWLILQRRFVSPVAVTVVGGIAATAAIWLGGEAVTGGWYRAVVVGGLLAVFVYGVVGLEATDRLVAPRWLQTLGDASYSLYLWHVLILAAMGRFLLARLPDNAVVHGLALVFTFAVVIVGSLIAYRLIERPLLRLFRGRQQRPGQAPASIADRTPAANASGNSHAPKGPPRSVSCHPRTSKKRSAASRGAG